MNTNPKIFNKHNEFLKQIKNLNKFHIIDTIKVIYKCLIL